MLARPELKSKLIIEEEPYSLDLESLLDDLFVCAHSMEERKGSGVGEERLRINIPFSLLLDDSDVLPCLVQEEPCSQANGTGSNDENILFEHQIDYKISRIPIYSLPILID